MSGEVGGRKWGERNGTQIGGVCFTEIVGLVELCKLASGVQDSEFGVRDSTSDHMRIGNSSSSSAPQFNEPCIMFANSTMP
jgi:hypothetical protein